MKLGVFGGTFDPIHYGHLRAAQAAVEQLGLDRLLLVVANDPWQKADRELAPAGDRLAMVEAAVRNAPRLEASDLEIARGGETFTADTLAELAERDPAAELFLVLGADAAAALDTWRSPDEVRRRATIAVVDRRPYRFRVPAGYRQVSVKEPNSFSSTEFRGRVTAGKPVDDLVPPAVGEYVVAHGLYR